MSLRHAILGFLSTSPKTGYDLQKKIDLSIQHFWPSTQSQVYRTLKELEADALIRCEIEYQSDKPNKKIYCLTDKGSDELLRWLSEPLKTAPHRNQFLVQLFFSRSVSTQTIVANLTSYRRELEERLHFLKAGEGQSRIALGSTAQERLLYRLIVENGICLLESEIGWVDRSREALQEAAS